MWIIMLRRHMNDNAKEVALLSLPPITFFLGDNILFYTFDLDNKIKIVKVVLLLPSKADSFQYDQLVVFSYSYYLVAFIITGVIMSSQVLFARIFSL